MQPPSLVLIDESFLLCASDRGCDSKRCEDDLEERDSRALAALLLAYEIKVSLVIDEHRQVIIFYWKQYQSFSHEVKKIINKWLSGRGGRLAYRKPVKISQKAIEDCNLTPQTLDPLLCALAVACRGAAPIWTLDSDFWCAHQLYPEVKPACPAEALKSVR